MVFEKKQKKQMCVWKFEPAGVDAAGRLTQCEFTIMCQSLSFTAALLPGKDNSEKTRMPRVADSGKGRENEKCECAV